MTKEIKKGVKAWALVDSKFGYVVYGNGIFSAVFASKKIALKEKRDNHIFYKNTKIIPILITPIIKVTKK